jgi:transcription antitermination factor NusG
VMAQRKDWEDHSWPSARPVPSQVERLWYVATAKPSQGKRAVYALHERDYDAYMPTETVWYRPGHGRSKVKQWRPLFGRYLFIGVAEGQGFHELHLIDALQGLLVDSKRAPAVIDFTHVDTLRTAETLGAFDKTNASTLDLRPGRKVVVLKPAYEGMIGQIARAKGDRRWQVFLDCMSIPINVEECELETIA